MDGGSGANSVIYGSANGYGGNGGGIKGDDAKIIFAYTLTATGGTQEGPGIANGGQPDCTKGKFGKGGDGSNSLQEKGQPCGGGGGYYGGAAQYLGGGGGSGHINFNFLKYAKTMTSSHTGNGECKITLLNGN